MRPAFLIHVSRCAEDSGMHFFPLAQPFMLLLLLIGAVVLALVELSAIEYAYARIGIDHRYVFSLLLLSLLGSYVNIPIAELPAEGVVSGQEITVYGMRYVIPVVHEWPGTVIAVNLGGAIIPTLLSVYLVLKNGLYLKSLAGVLSVMVIVHWVARPVAGVGIAVPTFVPPIVAAGVAMMLSRTSAPSLAYVAGSLGTLIGADLLNLDRLQGLGAPVASIGGAGTFDGIFLTGILAVLLA
jgi:uncharacterized membrane protein